MANNKKSVKKQAKRKEKPGLLDDETMLDIKAELDLDSINLKNKRWLVRLWIRAILPRSYHRYKLILELNEEPYIKRIDKLVADHEAGLFAKDPAALKDLNKKEGELRDELARLQKDCETFEFHATVEEIKYKDQGTQVLFRVPDDVIEPFNRQKHRMNLYNVTLRPEV